MSNKADDAIKKLVETVSRNQHMLERGTIGYTTARVRDEEAATELKQALYQDYLRLVGEDEARYYKQGGAAKNARLRNDFRAKLRTAGRKYYGVDT